MSSILDILGAMIIGAVLMLTANRSVDYGLREFINHNSDAIVQSNLSAITQILQEDLRKVGFGIPEAYQSTIIQTAQSNRLVFLMNLSGQTNARDTVEYSCVTSDTTWIIDAPVVLHNINRRIRLHGESSSTTTIGAVTNPSIFRYLDQIGNQTSQRLSIRMVEVTLFSANPQVYLDNATIQAANPQERALAIKRLMRESFWRQTRVVSRNLRR